jgi:hypothetical protein
MPSLRASLLVAGLAAFELAVSAVACGSPSHPPYLLDEGEADAGGAATDDGAAQNPQGCERLDLTHAPITGSAARLASAPPPMNGGAITPGDYYLTGATYYFPVDAGPGGFSVPGRAFRRYGPTEVLDHREIYLGGDGGRYDDQVLRLAYSVQGNAYTEAIEGACDFDASPPETCFYAATPTQILLGIPLQRDGGPSSDMFVQTYTRQ